MRCLSECRPAGTGLIRAVTLMRGLLVLLLLASVVPSGASRQWAPVQTAVLVAADRAPTTPTTALSAVVPGHAVRMSLTGSSKQGLPVTSYRAGDVAQLSAPVLAVVAAEEAGGIVYRTGSRTDNALSDASAVSFRDPISSSTSAEHPQVFRPGDKVWAVDTAKLRPESVLRDGVPPGHVSVSATSDEIRAAIIDDPFLADLGLKPLDEFGAYRIPR